MITKKLFLDALAAYEKYDNYENKMHELGLNLFERDEVQCFKNSFLDLLAYMCNDLHQTRYDSNNIEYFIYDAAFGKKADTYFIQEKDGTEIHFYTAEDLWNYLVNEHPEIEDKVEWKSYISDKSIFSDSPNLKDFFSWF